MGYIVVHHHFINKLRDKEFLSNIPQNQEHTSMAII